MQVNLIQLFQVHPDDLKEKKGKMLKKGKNDVKEFFFEVTYQVSVNNDDFLNVKWKKHVQK